MKANNLLYIIRWGNEKQQLRLIYALACVSLIAMLIVFIPANCPDTPTYYEAGERFLHGEIDAFRTPVYSVLCALTLRLEHLIGVIPSLSQLIMVVLQLAFYFISVRYFYRLCALFISGKAVLFIATALYATLPGFSLYSFNVLTESFAQSWFIIFCYYTIMFLRSHQLSWSVKSNLLLIVLLLLRPAFVFVLPVSFIPLVCLALKKARHAIAHGVGLVCVAVVFLGYCQWYYSVYGVFSMSSVSNVNQIGIMQSEGILDVSSLDSASLETIPPTIEYPYTRYKLGNTTPAQKQAIVSGTMKKHGKAHILYSLKKFIMLGGTYMHVIYAYPRLSYCCLIISLLTNYLGPTFYMIYALLFVYLLIILRQSRKGGLPIGNLFLCLVIAGMMVTAILGAPAEYERLILPSTPLILLLFAGLIDKLNITKKNGINFI